VYLLSIPILAWLTCFWLNKKGRIVPRVGGGCFGGGSKVEYKAPPAPKLPTAEEIYQQAISQAKTQTPLAYGAREKALGYMDTPQSTMDYYSQFQPTSFENALSNQYFQNTFPDALKQMRHRQSLSGFDTPEYAMQEGELRGKVGFDIGSYLSNLNNTRATNNLSTMLGIDPNTMISPYVSNAISQGNAQAQLDYQGALLQAQVDFQNALQEAKEASSMASMIGSGIGAIGGSFFGNPMLGASIGGTIGGQIGGGYSQAPIDLGTALSYNQNQGYMDIFDKLLNEKTAEDVFSYTAPSISAPSGYTGGITIPGRGSFGGGY